MFVGRRLAHLCVVVFVANEIEQNLFCIRLFLRVEYSCWFVRLLLLFLVLIEVLWLLLVLLLLLGLRFVVSIRIIILILAFRLHVWFGIKFPLIKKNKKFKLLFSWKTLDRGTGSGQVP